MRSLYVRIVVASFVTVLVSLGAFVAISEMVIGRSMRRLIGAIYLVQLDEARAAYERGGREELARFLGRLDAALDVTHHLTNASGRELTTGTDYSSLLAVAPLGTRGVMEGDRFVMTRASSDGEYRLIVTGTPPFTLWTMMPLYLLVLASIGLVSWWVAIGIVPPIRAMAEVAERFGRGDFAARVSVRPPKEIGTLATAFNQMADRIESLLQAERRLLQDVSHELRSPLARLNFSAELARSADDRGAAVDRIQKDLDRLSTLVIGLIEMTRAEGDPAARTRQPIDLDTLLTDVQATCARDAEAHGAHVVVSGRSGRALVGDREMLRWGFENVVRNAVRYTPAATAVEVQVSEVAGSAIVTVRDYGPGVPAAALARIFEPFYRVEESRTSATGGIGLGLAIARRAVLVHHGTIVAENATPGLLVTIALPLSPTQSGISAPADQS